MLGLEDQLQRHRSRAALLQEQVKEQQPPMRAPAASDDLPGPTAPPLLSVSPGTAQAALLVSSLLKLELWLKRMHSLTGYHVQAGTTWGGIATRCMEC